MNKFLTLGWTRRYIGSASNLNSGGIEMILPLDKTKRDSVLFQFSVKPLRAYIAPNHILLKIDELFDFSYVVDLVKPYYCPNNGRAAVHPEVLLRALLIGCIHNMASFRQLCLRIQENLAYRWFLFMTLEEEVFDHSTISYFISRIGEDTFRSILEHFNQRLYELGLVGDQVYSDSTLLKAHVDESCLSPTSLTTGEFVKKVIKENDIYIEPIETKVGDQGKISVVEPKCYQDSKGKLPLSPVDPDARWQAKSKKQRAHLSYKDNLVVDDEGFILAEKMTLSTCSDPQGAEELIEALPTPPTSLAADKGYTAGAFRAFLEGKGITPFIPLPKEPKTNRISNRQFKQQGEVLICPQGKTLKFIGMWRRNQSVQFRYRSRPQDCCDCPLKKECIKGKAGYRTVGISLHKEQIEKAKLINQTAAFKQAMKRRKTVVEGVIAHLRNLGLEIRLWGLEKVNIQGILSALAHNVLKAVKKMKKWSKAQAALCTTPSSFGFIPKFLELIQFSKNQPKRSLLLTSVGYDTQ
jgi:transposase